MSCDRCHYYTANPYLLCAVHPVELIGERCPDFIEGKAIPDEEELWTPEGMAWYGDDLIAIASIWAEVSDAEIEYPPSHPYWTGACPQCKAPFSFDDPPIHYDCDRCGWMDVYSCP
ncbi:MAG: hypothetical protein AAFY57_20595 [Cyanobacteria bacterium J06642_2]